MSRPSNRGSAVVIGAGIVGAACAHRLQTLGFDVVLVDRDLPGEACSFGNAGRIATSLVTPKSVPGLLRKVPGMLRDHRHPLKTSLGFVLHNLRWCIRFARAGAPGEVARITDALHVLLSRGDAAIDRLASAAGAMDVIQTDGVFYVYQDLGAGGGRTRHDGREQPAGHTLPGTSPAIRSATSIRQSRRRSLAGSTNPRSGSYAAQSSSRGRSSAPSPRPVAP